MDRVRLSAIVTSGAMCQALIRIIWLTEGRMAEDYRAYGYIDGVRETLDLPHETWVDQYECLANNLEMLEEGFCLGKNDVAYESLALMERNVVYAREWMEAHEMATPEAKARVSELWKMLQYHSPKSS